ncbi:MAG: Calx-beta domain-containing protein [Bacteroidota bacterium]
MRRYIFLLSLMGFAALFEACNDYDSTFDFTPKVQFSVGDTVLIEETLSLPIDVQLVGPQMDQPITVTWEVSGSAEANRDYNLSTDNSNTVTIAPNSSTASFTVDILNDAAFVDDTVVLVLTIVGATGGIGIGNDGEDRKQLTVTIIEDDCAIDWLVGTFDVTTTNTNPSTCENTTNVVTVSQVNGRTYEFSDITGGVYRKCFNLLDNPGQLVLEGGGLQLIDQPDTNVPPFTDVFNGEATLETCEQIITLTWSNGFGDRGTSVFRRRN